MANPFSSIPSSDEPDEPSTGSAAPPIPARGGPPKAADPADGPERTLLIKQEAFVYKIPPQVIHILRARASQWLGRALFCRMVVGARLVGGRVGYNFAFISS